MLLVAENGTNWTYAHNRIGGDHRTPAICGGCFARRATARTSASALSFAINRVKNSSTSQVPLSRRTHRHFFRHAARVIIRNAKDAADEDINAWHSGSTASSSERNDTGHKAVAEPLSRVIEWTKLAQITFIVGTGVGGKMEITLALHKTNVV